MKTLWFTLSVAVLSFAVGAGCVYLLMKPHPKTPVNEWTTVEPAGAGIFWVLDEVADQVPLPKTQKPTGKVKFLDRDDGTHLGYVVKVPMESDPTSKFPAKFLRPLTSKGGSSLGPPAELQIQGSFQFDLKDADGFELAVVSGERHYLASASENEEQGMVAAPVTASVAQRTKKVSVRFVADSCTPCTAR